MGKTLRNKKIVSLNAEIISGERRYAGRVENMSETRLFIISSPSNNLKDFKAGKDMELKLQLSTGDDIHLPCRICCSYKTPPHGLTDSMEIEILKQPPEYIKFLNTV